VHIGPRYLLGLLPANPKGTDALALRLSTNDAVRLRQSLLIDAENYYYSGVVSFFDAFLGLERRLFTWSTVQLYYSVFYSLRCLLALKGQCIYYCNDKPFTCSGIVGTPSSACKGTTHKIVLNLFSHTFAGDALLSQPIGGEPPLEWLMNRREDANYKQGRFADPDVPPHFFRVNQLGFRRAINAYLTEPTALYIFDADHAMIAFPLAVLLRARAELKSHNLQVDPEGSKFLSALGKDKDGRIGGLDRLL
jgi:hypothetical protein